MSDFQKLASSSPYENIVGYSRAVRAGSRIYVSGTTATDANGNLVAIGDAYGQAMQCLRNIGAALEGLGASLSDVVRTRMFVTDISLWPEFGRAHSAVFDSVRPCTSMLQVSALIHPQMLIEIEAEAEC